ncbi:MAG: SUMF1/EgtB/PvdO family nonheme iron enzyme [Polyangiaceae bacterium]
MENGRLRPGKYGIERVLGRGGMGQVVAARRLQLAERVARLQRAWVVSGGCLLAILGAEGCGRTELALGENAAGVSGVSPNSGSSAVAGAGAETAGGASSSGGFGADAGMGAVMAGGASGTGRASPVDWCASVSCETPPPAVCKTAGTATTYAATGKCSAGTCRYTPINTRCGTNQACVGAGVCSTTCKADSRCGASCAVCGGETPKCKDLGTMSQCVACLSDADCTEATPSCNTTTNVCVPPPPSCIGLAWTCGPSGTANCCASGVVTGGTFNRSNDPNYPATVSAFRLDTYEITVGRFRNFWKGYPGNIPASGSGKNPNNPSDRGWDATWNASALPASQAQLTANISCFLPEYQTWTAGNDALPMNCIDWYEAQAFCIWDGGRLPTEAEWNYAAAGGTAQRAYPWGSAAPDCSYANANFHGAAGGTDYCVAPGTDRANRVGSESPKGDGLYGQADLAGNVWEWAQDWYASPYPKPCDNCAYDEVHFGRVLRGGSFYVDDPSSLLTSYRSDPEPSDRDWDIGARCARAR